MATPTGERHPQLIGTCERCRQLAPLFVVPGGALREPYLCIRCARAAVREIEEGK